MNLNIEIEKLTNVIIDEIIVDYESSTWFSRYTVYYENWERFVIIQEIW